MTLVPSVAPGGRWALWTSTSRAPKFLPHAPWVGYGRTTLRCARPGERVAVGHTLGLVGMTVHATGPHLHFEVRLCGAAVDPTTALG
jgi:hypothetical protein